MLNVSVARCSVSVQKSRADTDYSLLCKHQIVSLCVTAGACQMRVLHRMRGGLRGGGGCRDLNAVVHYGALQWSRMGGRQSGAVNLA